METMHPLSHRPILIAERNPADLLTITRRIRAHQTHEPVIGFRDAQGVIDYLEQALRLPRQIALPGVLFTDVLLPRIDGISLITWIRRQPALRSLQIDVISASENPEHRDHALQAGARGFHAKFPSEAVFAELIYSPPPSVEAFHVA